LKYFDKHVDGGKSNAFRHAMFTALNTIGLNDKTAADFANAHENIKGNDSLQERNGNTNYQHMGMDLHNNALGIAIGNKVIADSHSRFVNYDKLAEIVYQVIIKQGKGMWLTDDLMEGEG